MFFKVMEKIVMEVVYISYTNTMFC